MNNRHHLLVRWRAPWCALALCLPMASWAHAPSNAYLTLEVRGSEVSQRLDVAVRDLDRELHLDANDDGAVTWGELRTRWDDVDALTRAALALHANSKAGPACQPGALDAPRVDAHSDGTHAVLTRRWQCPEPVRVLALRYQLFADSDPTHRAIVQLRTTVVGGPPSIATAVLAPGEPARLVGGAEPQGTTPSESPPSSFLGFVAEGVHHILIGTDHVLFLLSLLLPAVLVAVPTLPWHAAPRLKPVLLNVGRTVTAFTVAHSITLALATLGLVTPPTRWVESLIAVSVVLAALDNLLPVLPAARWKLTFLFGLVHGFGFAGALNDLGLDRTALASALLGFNTGVEIGQLGIVALFLPLAWWLRATRFYQRGVLGLGSAAIILMALGWLAERAWDLKLLPA